MTPIKRVALAGAGRIGGPIALELDKTGYQVTIFTRDATQQKGLPPAIRTQQVDYSSSSSLTQALRGHEALISTVAMSAISNQPLMIDAAIASGVKFFIPAEYTVNSHSPSAQSQPMISSVVSIQNYVAKKEGQISWFVINCGALLEFVLDHPVILDFDKQSATLWDGGEGAISLSDIPLLARAVSAVLRQPERVVNHHLRVHGGVITQNRALETAKQSSPDEKWWTAEQKDSQAAYSASMGLLSDGTVKTPEQLMGAMLTAYNAAAFGQCDGHFEAAYAEPDNAWLGIEEFANGEIEEAIKKKAAGTFPKSSIRSAANQQESLGDVAGELAAIHSARR